MSQTYSNLVEQLEIDVSASVTGDITIVIRSSETPTCLGLCATYAEAKSEINGFTGRAQHSSAKRNQVCQTDQAITGKAHESTRAGTESWL